MRESLLISALIAAVAVASACSPPTAAPQRSRYFTYDELATLPSLRVGDQAPALSLTDWVQGEPITDFASGQVRVIEFWATWCIPCLNAMAHLSDVQDRFGREVVIVAIGIVDHASTPERIRATVAERAGTLRVRVAADVGGAGTERYRIGVRDLSVPLACLIDGSGRLAWVGHPNDLDGPLAAVIDGTWDVEAAAREFARRAEIARATRVLVEEYIAAWKRNDDAAMLAATEKYCAYPIADVDGFSPPWFAWPVRVGLLVKAGRTAEAVRVAQEACDVRGVNNQPRALCEMARSLRPVATATAVSLAEKAEVLIREQERANDCRAAVDPSLEAVSEAWKVWNAWPLSEIAATMAAAGRYHEAVDFQRLAIERWPRDAEEEQNRRAHKALLAQYETAEKAQ